MSLPDLEIAKAFIESYITIRKSHWRFEVNDIIKMPDDPKVKHKLAICTAMLDSFENATSFEDWLAVLDTIYTKESAEKSIHKNRFTLTQWYIGSPLVADMLHAVRTYIISEIKSEDKFIEMKNALTDEKIKLEKQILWDKAHDIIQAKIDDNQKKLDAINTKLETCNDQDEYYRQFIKDKVIRLDPQSGTLDEKSFENFKENVEKKRRPLVICERLSCQHSEQKSVERPVEQAASSTQSEATSSKAAPAAESKKEAATETSSVSKAEPKQDSPLLQHSTFSPGRPKRKRKKPKRYDPVYVEKTKPEVKNTNPSRRM